MSVSVERTLEQLREEAAGCKGCDLWRCATQTVFGEGPIDAAMMLVGEQPGDQEDKQGHPFVGPAGGVLDKALGLAEIDRTTVYATNAVKHFKYRMRGKRRIHQRPNAGEVAACRRWLEAEVELISPGVIVALGAIAAHALMGRVTAVGENRGHPLESPLVAAPVVVTAHPSSVLRERDSEARHAALAALAADLRLAVQLAAGADGAEDRRPR